MSDKLNEMKREPLESYLGKPITIILYGGAEYGNIFD